jgi:hypothetical protein
MMVYTKLIIYSLMSLALSGYRVTQTKVKCRHRPPVPDDSIDAQSHSEQSAASRTRGTRAGHGSRRTGIARSEADDVMTVMMINKRSDR